LFDDLDFKIAETGADFIDLFGSDDVGRERVVDVVPGQVALLLGQTKQFLDLFGEIRSGLGFQIGDRVDRLGQGFCVLRGRRSRR
jgi:hypothetical protein